MYDRLELESIVLESEEEKAIDKEIRPLWILWAIMLGTLPILVVVGLLGEEAFRESFEPRDDSFLTIMRTILFVVSFASLMLSYFLRAGFISGKFAPFGSASSQPSETPDKPTWVARYRAGLFIPMVIPNAVAMYGFLLFFLGQSWLMFSIFLGLSALGIIYQRPNRNEFIDWLKREKLKEKVGSV
ncbi:MAG: hypothetical protein ACYTFM_12930 [Planctomycetota bacterium]|jgi:hypothetical protein